MVISSDPQCHIMIRVSMILLAIHLEFSSDRASNALAVALDIFTKPPDIQKNCMMFIKLIRCSSMLMAPSLTPITIVLLPRVWSTKNIIYTYQNGLTYLLGTAAVGRWGLHGIFANLWWVSEGSDYRLFGHKHTCRFMAKLSCNASSVTLEGAQ